MITIWLDRIDDTTNKAKLHFNALGADALNWKSHPEKWSIAQNIDHLMTIDTSYFPIIQAAESGNLKLPFSSQIGILVKGFGKMILGSVQPNRSRKSKTFPIWEPSTSDIPGSVILDFEFHQKDLKQLIERTKPLVEKGTVIHSPANRNIVYKLADAYEIITIHQQRHLAQALEVLQALPEELKVTE